jgi:hypothetical protein
MSAPRSIQDSSSQVKVSVALPNAANTTSTNVIDLGSNQSYPLCETIGVKLSNTLATGANSKNINFVLQHSNESNANFVNIPTLGAPIKVLAGNATKYPVSNATNITLPPGVNRYIKGSATGEADGGDAGDGTFTEALVF